MILLIVLSAVLMFSVLMTGLIRKYALSRSIIDIPNERSSHTIPTPRGGGAAIVILLLVSILYSYLSDLFSLETLCALGIGTFIVAIAGWVDDHRHIHALVRAIVYALSATWAIAWLNVEYNFYSELFIFPYGLISCVFIIIGIVWLTNLFNFMDGTDALAATQSICTSTAVSFLFWLEGQQGMMLVSSVMLASCCGFLYWNWPPAKIFMGDVGSCALGFCFAILAVLGEITNSIPIPVWFILLSVFICDATFTLLTRVVRGEQWYKAHKSHAYQRLVFCGMTHKKLVSLFLSINILVLWPLAWIVYKEKTLTMYVLFFVVLLMFVLWGRIQIYYNRVISRD